ncbi:hypothetical protein GCM10027428_35500 [Haliea atlantica]
MKNGNNKYIAPIITGLLVLTATGILYAGWGGDQGPVLDDSGKQIQDQPHLQEIEPETFTCRDTETDKDVVKPNTGPDTCGSMKRVYIDFPPAQRITGHPDPIPMRGK